MSVATATPIQIPESQIRRKSTGSSTFRPGTSPKSSSPRGRPVAATFNSKKGKGGGGKGSWGRIEDEIWAAKHVKPQMNEDDQGVVMIEKVWDRSPDEIQRVLESKLSQFFKSGDLDDIVEPILEIAGPEVNQQIIAFIVGEATRKNNLERELASTLLTTMAIKSVFTMSDMQAGFDEVMMQLDDLTLDTPNAHDIVGKFIARAVADEIIAPRFALDRPGPQDTDNSSLAFAKARGLIASPQGLERLTFIWGPSGSRSSVEDLQRHITLLLKEYLLTYDVGEAEMCIRDLHATHFHHEVVFAAIDLAIDGRSERDMLSLSKLLGVLCESALVSSEQLEKGMERVIGAMGDIQLDNPKAVLNFDSFCRVSSYIPREICARAAQLAKSTMNKSRGGRARSVTATAAL